MPPDTVPRETREKLDAYVALLIAENGQQNLIAASTVETIWERHIADSLQLSPLGEVGRWLDIGSGAGLPGIVLAIAQPRSELVLVEPRTRRAAFLEEVSRVLGLGNVIVHATRIERVPPVDATVITARAVASLDGLLAMSIGHARPDTLWLLPKGRRAAEEVAAARRTWQGHFELVPSSTDAEASIVMARDVKRRGTR